LEERKPRKITGLPETGNPMTKAEAVQRPFPGMISYIVGKYNNRKFLIGQLLLTFLFDEAKAREQKPDKLRICRRNSESICFFQANPADRSA
jgi:hypothetical protein